MIKITVDDRDVQKMLKDLAGRVQNRQPLMKKIAGIMYDAVEENFRHEGRPRWKPSKRANMQGGQTLQDTGSLAASISKKHDNNSAQVGTNKVYAAVHQFGFKGRVNIPSHTRRVKKGVAAVKAHSRRMNIHARPFLKLTDGDLNEIKKTIMKYFMKYLWLK